MTVKYLFSFFFCIDTVSDYLPPVENLTVTAAGPDYITLGWNVRRAIAKTYNYYNIIYIFNDSYNDIIQAGVVYS